MSFLGNCGCCQTKQVEDAEPKTKSLYGSVEALVSFEVWHHGGAEVVNHEYFDCAPALDNLSFKIVSDLVAGVGDTEEEDEVYREAAALGIVSKYNGPFTCMITDPAALGEYVEKRKRLTRGDAGEMQLRLLSDSETGYICPKCGWTKNFDADTVILHGTTFITSGGWNYFDFSNDVELHDSARLTCGNVSCGYEGPAAEFQKQEVVVSATDD